MASSREAGKQQKRQKIISLAAQLIEREGMDCTTVEKIAASAGIGVGTFYNYFKSKEDLAIEILLREKDSAIAEAQKVLHSPPDDAIEAITGMLLRYHLDFARKYDRKLLRGLYGGFMSGPDDYRREGLRIDYWQITLLTTLVEFLQQRGKLRHGIKAEEASLLLYHIANHCLLEYCINENIDITLLEKMIRRNVFLTCIGLAEVTDASRRYEQLLNGA